MTRNSPYFNLSPFPLVLLPQSVPHTPKEFVIWADPDYHAEFGPTGLVASASMHFAGYQFWEILTIQKITGECLYLAANTLDSVP